MSYLPIEILNIVASYADVTEAVVIGTDSEELRRRVLLIDAIKKSQFDVLRWLEKYDRESLENYSMDDCEFPAGLIPFDVFRWLVERNYGRLHLSSLIVCFDYNLRPDESEIIKRLNLTRSYKGLNHDTFALDWAANSGYLSVVRWLHENRAEGCTTFAMDSAAANGDLDLLRWLHDNRTEGCTTAAMDLAAKNGHHHIIRFLYANRTEGCTARALRTCVLRNDDEVQDILKQCVIVDDGATM